MYLLDALDELPRGDRVTFAEMVRGWELAALGGQARMASITSRIAGYQPVLDSNEQIEVEVLPFTPKEVNSYIDSSGISPASSRSVPDPAFEVLRSRGWRVCHCY